MFESIGACETCEKKKKGDSGNRVHFIGTGMHAR